MGLLAYDAGEQERASLVFPHVFRLLDKRGKKGRHWDSVSPLQFQFFCRNGDRLIGDPLCPDRDDFFRAEQGGQ